MSLQSESRNALEILERVQERLSEEGGSEHSENLSSLIYLLDSPLFNQLLSIQDSLYQLKQWQSQRSLGPDDFQIDAETGRLALQPQHDDPFLHEGHGTTGTISSQESVPIQQQQQQQQHTQQVPESPTSVAGYEDTSIEKTILEAADGRKILNISLHKAENSSLGFSVVGLRSENKGELGIFVQEIQPDGIAARDGRLQENDQILAINEQVLDASISHQQAIRILQQAKGAVQLTVARGALPRLEAPSTPSSPAQSQHQQQESAESDLERQTSSALSETNSDMVLGTEWTQLEVIDLINDGSGLGFGIIGGKSTGVVVKTILPGGVADRDGRLRSGDHIMQIGDVHVRGMGSEQVASVLRQSGAHVRLIVARSIQEPSGNDNLAHAPIVPTHQLDEHLHHFNATLMALDNPDPGDLMGMTEGEINSMGYGDQYMAQLQQYNNSMATSPTDPGSYQGQQATDEVQVFEVDLVKGSQGLGITIAGYVADPTTDDLSGIFVRSVAELSATAIDGRVQVHDQIIEVDGQSLEGYNNQQAVEVLRNTGQVVHLKLARYLNGAKYQQLQQYANESLGLSESVLDESGLQQQLSLDDISLKQLEDDYSSELTLDVEQKLKEVWQARVGDEYHIVVAQLSKFREGGGLGISLEGTVDVENGVEVRPHHYIRSVLPDGPIGINGKLTSGDELLEVNSIQLLGLNHVEVVGILKELPQHVRIVCARKIAEDSSTEDNLTSSPYATVNSGTGSEPLFDFQSSILQPGGSIGSDGGTGSIYPHHEASDSGTSLEPQGGGDSNRLYKAKSDQVLMQQGSGDSGAEDSGSSLQKGRARSLELSGLAMWSGEPETIELHKGPKGLGFSILDYQDPINPMETVIVIRSLVPGGVAQIDGRLIPGDRLVFVNDVNLENATLEEAVQALKGAERGMVRVGVCKPLPLPEIGESSTDPDDFLGESEETSLPPAVVTADTPPPTAAPPPPPRSSSPTSTPLQLSTSASLQSPRPFKPTIGKKPEPSHVFLHQKRSSTSSPDHDQTSSPISEEKKLKSSAGSFSDTSISPTPDLVIQTENLGSHSPSHHSGSHSPRSPRSKPLSPRGRFGGLMLSSSPPETDAPDNIITPTQITTASTPPIITTASSTPSSSNPSSPRSMFSTPPIRSVKPVIAPKPRNTPQLNTYKDKSGVSSSSPIISSSSSPHQTAQTQQVELSGIQPSIAAATAAASSDLITPATPTTHTTQSVPSSTSSYTGSTQPRVLPASLEQTIKIKKGSDQLGITVEAADQGINGCIVKTILPSGAIAKDGRIAVGDHIVSVNNESTRRITNAQARAILRRASLLGTDISRLPTNPNPGHTADVNSVTYIPSSVASEYLSSSQVLVKDQGPPPPAASQLSPNSSLQQPGTQPSLKLTGGSHVDGGRSAAALNTSPLGYISPIPDSAVTGLAPTASASSTHGAKSYQAAGAEGEGDSVASSWGRPRTVEIHRKEGESLGISIVGGRVDLFNVSPDTQRSISGIFIKHVLEGSPAGRNGTLNTGDRILQVDGVNLREATHDAAVEAIKKSRSPVIFTVQSLVDPDWKDKVSTSHKPAEKSNCDPPSLPVPLHEEDEFGYSVEKLMKAYGELPGNLHLIELQKAGVNGIGLSLAGNVDLATMSVFIVGIKLDSLTAKDGRIRIGDEILEVNGHSLLGRSHLNASAIIKGIQTPKIKFVLLRRDDSSTLMAVRPVKNSHTDYREDPNTLIPKTMPVQQSIDSETSSNTESATSSQHQPQTGSATDTQEAEATESSAESSQAPEAGNTRTETTITPSNSIDLSNYPNAKKVVLQRGSQGLGFAIQAVSSDGRDGIFVKSVSASGPAAQCGDIHIGDQLLSAESQSLVGVTYDRAIESIRSCRGEVNLLILPASTAVTETTADVKVEVVVAAAAPVVQNGLSPAAADSSEESKKLEPEKPSSPGAGDKHLKPTGSPQAPRRPSLPPPPPAQDPATAVISPGKETMIQIEKGKSGLGLSIVGGADTLLGAIIIHEVYEDGAAAKDGRLWAGDQILDVCGDDLREASHDRAIQVLRQTPATVTITVFRDESMLKDEDMYEIFTVELLKKPGKGLGISIVGRRNDTGVFISDVVKGGCAEADGRLQQGDQILSVNGEELKEAHQENAAALLKTLMGKVSLVVGRLKGSSTSSSRRNSSLTGSDRGMKKSDSNLSNSKAKARHTKNPSASSSQQSLGADIQGVTLISYRHKGSSSGSMVYAREVELSRDGGGSLGLSIAGGRGSALGDMPIIVASMSDYGPATQSGKIKVGDQILAINQRSTANLTHHEAVDLLKCAQGTVILQLEHGEEMLMTNTGVPEIDSLPHSRQSSAEHETQFSGCIQSIRLEKGVEGLGFSIVGGYGSPHGDLPIYVKNVFETGAAARDGRLKRGDQMISVNEHSLEGASHEDAVTLLKQLQGVVELKVLQ